MDHTPCEKAVTQPAGLADVESYLTALTATLTTPGIQYRVVTSTDLVYEHVSGSSDLSRRVPVDTAMTMMAYSMRCGRRRSMRRW